MSKNEFIKRVPESLQTQLGLQRFKISLNKCLNKTQSKKAKLFLELKTMEIFKNPFNFNKEKAKEYLKISLNTFILENVNSRLAERELSIILTESAKNYVVEHGYDPIYGARPLKRYIQKTVETLAAKLILSDQVSGGDTIVIDVVADELVAKRK